MNTPVKLNKKKYDTLIGNWMHHSITYYCIMIFLMNFVIIKTSEYFWNMIKTQQLWKQRTVITIEDQSIEYGITVSVLGFLGSYSLPSSGLVEWSTLPHWYRTCTLLKVWFCTYSRRSWSCLPRRCGRMDPRPSPHTWTDLKSPPTRPPAPQTPPSTPPPVAASDEDRRKTQWYEPMEGEA